MAAFAAGGVPAVAALQHQGEYLQLIDGQGYLVYPWRDARALAPDQLTERLGSSGIVTIGTGSNHACAAHQTHTVYCWGLNNKGQLGNDTTTNSPTPVTALGT